VTRISRPLPRLICETVTNNAGYYFIMGQGYERCEGTDRSFPSNFDLTMEGQDGRWMKGTDNPS